MLRPGGPFQRNPIGKILRPLLIFVEHFVLFRAKPSRRQTTHRSPMLAPIVRQTHRQLRESAGARTVRPQSRISGHAGHRTYINDPPVSVRNHPPRHRLGHKKASAQIRVQNQIPIVPSHIQRRLPNIATRIVHQHIQMPKRFLCLRRHPRNALQISHIELQRNRPTPQPFDFRFERTQTFARPARQHQISAGLRERPSHVLPQSAARAGNNSDASGKIKQSTFIAVTHKTGPGVSTTFSKFGSRAYNRSNHCGPSAIGAIAVISGFTRIAPRAINSIACGYSPADAHDPCNRICRVTTFCSGSVVFGDIFPTRTTVPPFRTLAIAAFTVSFRPTASIATSTPTPPVRCKMCATTSLSACNTSVAPSSFPSFNPVASTSEINTRLHPPAPPPSK